MTNRERFLERLQTEIKRFGEMSTGGLASSMDVDSDGGVWCLIAYKVGFLGYVPPKSADQEQIADWLEEEENREREVSLKPCPFCGSKAVIDYDCGGYMGEYQGYYIRCSNADCIASSFFDTDSHLKNAIEGWNRRS